MVMNIMLVSSMDMKGASGEVSDGNEEPIIGNRRKGHKAAETWLNCILVLTGK